MAYTQEELKKYYEELKTMSQCTGKPVISIEELKDYLDSKDLLLEPDTPKQEAVNKTRQNIKEMMLQDVGGSNAIGKAFKDIKKENDEELKRLAETASQKEKKMMEDAKRRVIREAKAKLDRINEKQRDADAVRKGYGNRERRPYASAENRRQYVGRGYWNPLRFLLAPLNFGFKGWRHSGEEYPERLVDGGGNPVLNDYESYEINHMTEDGKLVGRTYEPDNWNPETGKVVLYFSGSGGPAAEYFNNSCAEYVRKGIKVVSFDYRGFGNSMSLDKDGHPKRTRLSEESMYKDGHEMYSYVVNKLKIKPENIILHGYSLGGPIASRIAADVSEVNQISDTMYRERQGKILSESRRLGGLVLQSPMDSNYRVASRFVPYIGYAISGPLAWLGCGGLNTKSHLNRLAKYDPNIPVYITGGDKGPGKKARDHLSPAVTKIHESSGRLFHNMTMRTHEGGHFSRMEKGDPAIAELAQHGRKAHLENVPRYDADFEREQREARQARQAQQARPQRGPQL